ncbi:MAG TPA: carboxypeptidase-like regulatory domain-containing protein [Thermoanaerobaculia bacterium]|nr:carboxypeptidase-like regulatory domain-containing protein [Thermoanaerobaculia bacterium]
MINRRLLTILLLLSGPAAFAATISGTVTAAGTGYALGGIVVSAYSPAGVLRMNGTTDSMGRYTLTVPAGETRLLAYDLTGIYATSYYSNAASFETSQTLTLSMSQSLTGINFSLIKGGRITGSVVAEANGVALQGTKVAAYTLHGIRREHTTSDAAGNFSLLLPPGDYILASWDDQYLYVSEFYQNTSKASQATPVRIASGEVRSGHRFTLTLGARVSGTVIEQSTGSALAGIIVSAYKPTGELLVDCVSTSSGQFNMAVPPGATRFVAHDNTAVYAGSFYDNAEAFVSARELELSGGQIVSGIDFALVKGGRISGRVSNVANGAPLEAIGITIYTSSEAERAIAYTDANGAYSVFLAPTYYKVAAWDERGNFAGQFWSGKSTFVQADPALVISQQSTAVNFAMSAPARVSGNVYDPSGFPLGGVAVAALDATGASVASALSETTGAYSLSLSAGTYTLMATDPAGRYPASIDSSPRTLTSGQVMGSVDFHFLAPNGRRRAVSRASSAGKTETMTQSSASPVPHSSE